MNTVSLQNDISSPLQNDASLRIDTLQIDTKQLDTKQIDEISLNDSLLNDSLLNDSSRKFITLNARGTKIQVPISIAKKSSVIKTWLDAVTLQVELESDTKDDEEFYLNFNPQKVHDMIDELYGYSNVSVKDYLIIDVCKLSWQYINRLRTRWHLLSMQFSFTNMNMRLACKYESKYFNSTKNMYYNCDTNVGEFIGPGSDDYYINNDCFSFETKMERKLVRIPISVGVFCETLRKLAKKRNITSDSYIHDNNFCHHLGHANKIALILGLTNSVIRGELLQNLMSAYEKDIKTHFNVSDNIFEKMLKSLDCVVHTNNNTLPTAFLLHSEKSYVSV